MKLTLKGSSAISHASYNMHTHTLTLTFTSSGQGYDYYEVPPRIVLGLKKLPRWVNIIISIFAINIAQKELINI